MAVSEINRFSRREREALVAKIAYDSARVSLSFSLYHSLRLTVIEEDAHEARSSCLASCHFVSRWSTMIANPHNIDRAAR